MDEMGISYILFNANVLKFYGAACKMFHGFIKNR
jgi:hypothetical protein